MGDRTSFSIVVYACPDDQVEAALEVIHGFDLKEEWGDKASDSTEIVNVEFMDEEISCGTGDELASELIAAAPGCVFECHEDPKYEWLGSYNAYTPELGRFGAACDADGGVIIDASTLNSIMAECLADRNQHLLLQSLLEQRAQLAGEGPVPMSPEVEDVLAASARQLAELQDRFYNLTGAAWTGALNPYRNIYLKACQS